MEGTNPALHPHQTRQQGGEAKVIAVQTAPKGRSPHRQGGRLLLQVLHEQRLQLDQPPPHLQPVYRLRAPAALCLRPAENRVLGFQGLDSNQLLKWVRPLGCNVPRDRLRKLCQSETWHSHPICSLEQPCHRPGSPRLSAQNTTVPTTVEQCNPGGTYIYNPWQSHAIWEFLLAYPQHVSALVHPSL